jgi:hypothetical protein
MLRKHGLGAGRVGARDQYIDAVGRQTRKYLDDLLRRLARGKDDLRQAGAQAAVMIDPRVPEVFERKRREPIRGGFGCDRAALDLGE